ncbi:hypothetical protein [Psychroserpens sp.]|uniref:hypothetical protein n=1 Tax=Psychroserpens sp. TaxID=2020870 RepID=UPI00385F69DE
MRKIVIAIILIACFACNSDSEDNEGFQQNSVSKIVTTTYVLGNPEVINRKNYLNNRPKVDSVYSVSNDIWIYINFFYENDRLVRRETNTEGSNQVDEFLIDYDDFGRIIQTTETTNSFTSSTSFTYEELAITSVNNYNGDITTKVFHLNTDGIIYKEVNSNGTLEVLYDQDYNVISFNSLEVPISTYTYDNNLLPPDNFQFFKKFMLGDYKNNVILFENSISGAAFSDIATIPKYHLSVTNSSFTHTYEWTFNNNGYPISRKTLDENNHLIFQIEYFYN